MDECAYLPFGLTLLPLSLSYQLLKSAFAAWAADSSFDRRGWPAGSAGRNCSLSCYYCSTYSITGEIQEMERKRGRGKMTTHFFLWLSPPFCPETMVWSRRERRRRRRKRKKPLRPLSLFLAALSPYQRARFNQDFIESIQTNARTRVRTYSQLQQKKRPKVYIGVQVVQCTSEEGVI